MILKTPILRLQLSLYHFWMNYCFLVFSPVFGWFLSFAFIRFFHVFYKYFVNYFITHFYTVVFVTCRLLLFITSHTNQVCMEDCFVNRFE